MKASEVGLPTFEASVSCGAYCYGGSVNMQPTTCAEYEEAEFVWVRGDVAGEALAAKQRHIQHLLTCTKDQARRIELLELELSELRAAALKEGL